MLNTATTKDEKKLADQTESRVEIPKEEPRIPGTVEQQPIREVTVIPDRTPAIVEPKGYWKARNEDLIDRGMKEEHPKEPDFDQRLPHDERSYATKLGERMRGVKDAVASVFTSRDDKSTWEEIREKGAHLNETAADAGARTKERAEEAEEKRKADKLADAKAKKDAADASDIRAQEETRAQETAFVHSRIGRTEAEIKADEEFAAKREAARDRYITEAENRKLEKEQAAKIAHAETVEAARLKAVQQREEQGLPKGWYATGETQKDVASRRSADAERNQRNEDRSTDNDQDRTFLEKVGDKFSAAKEAVAEKAHEAREVITESTDKVTTEHPVVEKAPVHFAENDNFPEAVADEAVPETSPVELTRKNEDVARERAVEARKGEVSR